MIEAQQRVIQSKGAVDISELDPVLLTTDSGPMRCRRILDKLRAAGGAEIPDPRNPALNELVEKPKQVTKVRSYPWYNGMPLSN